MNPYNSEEKDFKFIRTDREFNNLHNSVSALSQGDLFIIETRSPIEKIEWVLNIVEKAIDDNETIGCFLLEMTPIQLMLRMLSTKIFMPFKSFTAGDLNDEQWSKLSVAISALAEKNIYIDEGGYASIDHVRSALRKLKAKQHDVSVVIMDYLPFISAEGEEGKRQEISQITRELKKLAHELNISIFVLSHSKRINAESKDQLKNMVDIVDIVSDHIQINKTGANFKGCCPFHKEKTPSFVVSPSKQIYHCFGCGVGGDVFKFVQALSKVSFVEAVESVASRVNFTLEYDA